MLAAFIEKTLQNRFWVLGIFFLLSVYGLYQTNHLPIDAVPDITNVQVMINTKTGALDPERIERSVSYAIETEMSGLPGIVDIRSLSKYGLSQVILVFKDGTDLYFIRQQVAQRLQNLRDQLPAGMTPELAPITTGLGEIVMYTVEGKPGSKLLKEPEEARLRYLRTIQDHVIRPELKKIEGIADIDSNGGYRKEIHVNVNTRKLEMYGITFDDLLKKLQTVGESYGGGYIQSEGKQVIVRSSSSLPDLRALEQIPIKLNVRGQPVLVRDVAGVREDHTQRLGAATVNGQQAVLGTALMYIGANSRKVSMDVVQAIEKLQLPSDIYINIVYTRTFLVNETIRTVVKNLAEGAALVVLVLLLLLGNFRAAVSVAMAIPISMLFAIIGMHYMGISANLMSLGAIDFGLLVDGSVVMIENLMRKLEHEKNPNLKDRLQLVKESTLEVIKPVSLGLFIIMIVYVPILSLQGIEGKMFHPMAVTVLMALGASLLTAIFLMPVLGFMIIRPAHASQLKHPVIFEWLSMGYKLALNWALKYQYLLFTCAIAIAILSLFILTRLGSNFIPQLDEGDLVAGLVRDNSISLDHSILNQKKAEEIIRQFTEVERVFSRIGTPESATDPMGVNFADTFIILKKDPTQWPTLKIGEETRVRTKQELMTSISEKIQKELPGHEVSPTQPIAMRFNEILEGSRADVSLRIYGTDLDKLMKYIEQAKEIIKKIPGVAEAEMDALTALKRSPVLNINLNYTEMAKYGVNLSDANSTLIMAMGGTQVGNFYEAERRFPVMLHLSEELRENPDEIGRIPVALSEGGSLPLKTIATIDQQNQVTTIARSFGKRYAALAIFLKERDLAGFVAEAKSKINSELNLDSGYLIEWGGQFKNLERARLQLFMIVPITLLVIFILLLRNFKSLSLTFLVYSSIPFAVTGGILALFLRGIPFSISAAIGFIALLGLSILNSMVLVEFINHLRERGFSVVDAVKEGALTRLRPVLMTALVAALGFFPMAMNHGLGAEVQRPLATVVIGGLLSSTFLTLFLLPIGYIWLIKGSKSVL
ncbi:MAG: CusA/CzcA family heavy metal efflux RND transporter [Bdellovibrionales bacterium]|nr:CusA/CzcA family heavy metal efflux RND transporter [Bdellovibrionales bacterium]